MVTLATGMFLLLTCMHFWVWGLSRRWSACVTTTYELVRDCRKFEKHRFISRQAHLLILHSLGNPREKEWKKDVRHYAVTTEYGWKWLKILSNVRFSEGLWQWPIYYRNTMLDMDHCLRFSWYTYRFGNWLYSSLQVIGCHYTDRFFIIFYYS
jgi:hypothetical protein